jgi:hypothetical protein
MKLRVWWIPQVPGKQFFVPVQGFVQAKLILAALAHYDLFQFENRIKPDYCNAGGLEVWNENSSDDNGNPVGVGGWEEWDDYSQTDPCATYGNIDDIDNERAQELDRREGIINKVIEEL